MKFERALIAMRNGCAICDKTHIYRIKNGVVQHFELPNKWVESEAYMSWNDVYNQEWYIGEIPKFKKDMK